MMKKFASVITSAAVLLNVFAAPALATTELTIIGNGVDSNNTVNLDMTQTRTVVQDNNADINNNVDAGASTGGNTANKNNAGQVTVDTGDAGVVVDVYNDVNTNHAELDCCGNGDVVVNVSDNAADTVNKVDLDLEDKTEFYQTNKGDVDNDVDAWAKTGYNTTNKNNGGDVDVDTGSATIDIDLTTIGNSNSAKMSGSDNGGSVSAWVVGNAAETKNVIDLDLAGSTLVTQDNDMDVDNDVDAYAKTGKNKANKNNGGDVSIDTWDATVMVDVDNMVNFNWADVECDCLVSDLTAKVADNASDSANVIKVALADDLEVYQENCGNDHNHGHHKRGRHHRDCGVDNDVDAYAYTGKNDANTNNGDHDSDPAVTTGNATTDVSLENIGNSNVYGEAPDYDFDYDGININISLDLAALLGL